MKNKVIQIKAEKEKEKEKEKEEEYYIAPHTCPYAEDINGDSETLCQCDEEKTRQCAMDI